MLSLDLRNVDVARVGPDRGLDIRREFGAAEARVQRHAEALWARRDDSGAMLGWIDLADGHGAEAEAIAAFAAEARGRFDDLVVLGIGGSSLGARTVAAALQPPQRTLQGPHGPGLRLHFVDNVDPDVIHGLQSALDPDRTLVNVISKSGTTAETMAAYLSFDAWLRGALGDAEAEARTVVTTDPESGILRPFADARGLRAFAVPPSVGGRFSVLSPVGLLPLALAGIDVGELLRGAAWANEDVRRPLRESVARRAALVQDLAARRRGVSTTVLMPYATRLRELPPWFVQLWAESLGKRFDRDGAEVHTGTTPLPAVGTTDQHAQVQLFAEGPFDKLIAFVRVDAFEHEPGIPAPREGLEKLGYLGGKDFAALLGAEATATARALADARRPNYTLRLPRLEAAPLGALLQMLMWQTALVGEAWHVDAFDQPGVEAGKRYTYALMGREGFEAERAALADGDEEPGP